MKGFTLIELLISLAIFALIGLATVQQINQIQSTKSSALSDVDLFNDVRSALSMMRNDLALAFHIPFEDLGPGARAAVARGVAIPRTIFDGREQEMVLTSLSHRNFYEDRRESDQTEISYFLHTQTGAPLSSLMKRESELIDADPFQGGTIIRLLDGVESIKFEYWEERQQRWVSDWNSEGGSTFDRFPLQVRVSIAVAGQKQEVLEVVNSFKISFPNNKTPLVQF